MAAHRIVAFAICGRLVGGRGRAALRASAYWFGDSVHGAVGGRVAEEKNFKTRKVGYFSGSHHKGTKLVE